MLIVLFFLSSIGGFLSGILGVGGAVVLIPLLLSVPQLFGVGSLAMNQVAGITMIQVLTASISGCLTHMKSGHFHKNTILTIGIPMGLFSFVGALSSKYIDNLTMKMLFGGLVIIAFAILLKKNKNKVDNGVDNDFDFSFTKSVVIGSSVGLISGIVGAGGGFILIPLMIAILKIPMRVTVGSSLGIVFIGSLMGSVGKLLTAQVEWQYLIPVVMGSIPFSILGAKVSKKLPTDKIKTLLIFVVAFVLIKTWWNIIQELLK